MTRDTHQDDDARAHSARPLSRWTWRTRTGHIRDVFYQCLEAWSGRGPWYAPLRDIEDVFWTEADETAWQAATVEQRARWLVGQLWNCDDQLPGDVVRDLEDVLDTRLCCTTCAGAVRMLVTETGSE
jgi:hypothetical protein